MPVPLRRIFDWKCVFGHATITSSVHCCLLPRRNSHRPGLFTKLNILRPPMTTTITGNIFHRTSQGLTFMAISIQRLTLFAIFDALEKDLRSVLRLEVSPDTNFTYLLNEQEFTKVHQRSTKADSTTSIEPDDDDRLLHFLYFLDVLHIINRKKNKLHKRLSDYFSRITPTLEKCAPVRNAVMHGRPLEIDDFPLSRTRFPWTQNWLNRSVQGGPEHDR